MAATKRERKELAKTLKQARIERVKLLKNVEKARVKFEKRTRKLEEVEATIADILVRLYGPQAPESALSGETASPSELAEPEEQAEAAISIAAPAAVVSSNGEAKDHAAASFPEDRDAA